MGYRIDACRVEIEVAIEFEGRMTIRFDVPGDDPLVAELLRWNDARLLALAQAAGDQMDLLKGMTMKVHRIEIRPTRTATGVQWAWHAMARNGRKLGWTGERHLKRAHCIAALVAVTDAYNREIPVVEFNVAGKEV